MAESLQHTLDRVRRPRVHITYDVEIGGAIQLKELPFVLGVMADLSGKPAEPLPPLVERKFVEIDQENFDTVLDSMKPRLAFEVDNPIDTETRIKVELNFHKLDDFEPTEVARQVPALRKLLEARERLSALLTKMDGNDGLSEELRKVLRDAELLQRAIKEAGLEPAGDAGETPSQG
jgi:type VI secretion system protein ImpB